MGMKWRLTLVVQQFLSRLGGVLGVGALNNGVDGAGFLAETAVDALGHVDIVTGGSARAVGTLFGLNGDGLGRADLRTVSGWCFGGVSLRQKRTASQSLQAMQRSSPEGYRRRACSPRNRGEMGPYIKG